MRFVKRLIILSGEGGKGTLGLEKNAYGVFAKLNTYGRPLMSADVVLRIDGRFFSHSLSGSRDSFSLAEMESMDVIHAAVFSGGELMMYGTNDAQRLDKAAVQAFARHKQGGGGKSGLFSGRKSVDSGAFGNGLDRVSGGSDTGRVGIGGASAAEQVAYRDDQIAEENFYPEALHLGRRTDGDIPAEVTQAEVAAALTLQRSLQSGDGQNGQNGQYVQKGQTDKPKTGLEKLMRSTPYKIKMHRPLTHGQTHNNAVDGQNTYGAGNAENEASPAAMQHMFVMGMANLMKSSQPSAAEMAENDGGASRGLHKDNRQKAVQSSTYPAQNAQQNTPQKKPQYTQQQNPQGGKPQTHEWQRAKSREDFFEEERRRQAGAPQTTEYIPESAARFAADFGAGTGIGAGIDADIGENIGVGSGMDVGAGVGADVGSGFGEGITGVFSRTSYIGMMSPDDGTGASLAALHMDSVAQSSVAGNRDDKRNLRGESRHAQTPPPQTPQGPQGERPPKVKQDPHIKARQSTFFEQNGEEIEKLFSGPREKQLEQLLPNSKWVRIDYDDTGKYYVIGIIGKEYLCYGVPASFTPDPPEELMGYCWWLPLDSQQPEGKGYWIMYQNLSTGEAVFPV